MKTTDIQLKKSEVITEILCDCCGNSCKVYESVVNNDLRTDDGEKVYGFEYLQLKSNCGYHSNKDMQQWSAQICEKCVDTHLSFVSLKLLTMVKSLELNFKISGCNIIIINHQSIAKCQNQLF